MFRILVLIVIALSAIAVSSTASAQEAASPPPAFCADKPGFSDWDFWLGDWDVYSNDEARQLQGTNSITKHHGDCLIKESWQNVQGDGGFSVNYYNPVKDEWRQLWVANGYSIDYTRGLNEEGAMVLKGHIYSFARNAATSFRGTWTANDDGTVVQFFEIHNSEDDTWSVWFDGLYVRKGD